MNPAPLDRPSSRIEAIDCLKGMTILLVVLGHAIQRTNPGFATDVLWRTIYSFHMPLLFFLSGYVVSKRLSPVSPKWLFGRTAGLLVPFVSWLAIFYFASRFNFTGLRPWVDYDEGFLSYMRHGLITPGNGLWYLWILWLCYVGAALVGHFRRFSVFGLMLVEAVLLLLPWSTFGLPALRWYFIFFVGGTIAPRLVAGLKKRDTSWCRPVCLAAFPVFTVLSIMGFSPVDPAFAFEAPVLTHLLWKFIWACSGIACMVALVGLLPSGRYTRSLAGLGAISLEIYATHLLFLGLAVGTGWTAVFSSALFALAGGVILAGALELLTPLKGLLYGRWTTVSPYRVLLGRRA